MTLKDFREKLVIPAVVAIFTGFFSPFAPAIINYFSSPHIEIIYKESNAPILDSLHRYDANITPQILNDFFKTTGYSNKIQIISIKIRNISDYTGNNVVLNVPGIVYAMSGGNEIDSKYKVIDLSANKKININKIDPGEELNLWAISNTYISDYDYAPPFRATLDGSKIEPKLSLRDEFGVIGAVAQNPGGFALLFFSMFVIFLISIVLVIFSIVVRNNIEFHAKNVDAKTLKKYQSIIDYVAVHDPKKAQDAALRAPLSVDDRHD